MKQRALDKAFQTEFRSLIAHDAWKFDDDFSGQLHVSCSKALGQDALCGLNIWEIGALKRGNSEHGTLQVSGWCRINSLERRVLELFGDKFENPYNATCDGYLRMIAPNMANEYGLYDLCFDDRFGSEIKSFWGSLISQADIFFSDLINGRFFDEVGMGSYFGDPIRWEVRRVVWGVEFSARKLAPGDAISAAKQRMESAIEKILSARRNLFPVDVLSRERHDLTLKKDEALRQLLLKLSA